MGIDIHALNFLRYVENKQSFGDTITVGRQGLHVSESVVRQLIGADSSFRADVFCEKLLTEYFGAKVVESVDNNAYEGATHIHDMNEPLPKSLTKQFDTVIDGGCLEHLFNVPQALKNCSLLCKPNGQIVHILPANNFCGHGFWQFSPELFFSLYSKENGYHQTEVFVADLTRTKHWYQVQQPKEGKRVNILSSSSLYVLVRTVLPTGSFTHSNIQQSDYVYEWASANHHAAKTIQVDGLLVRVLKANYFVHKLLSLARQLYLKSKASNRLNSKNPGLLLIDVDQLLALESISDRKA